MTKFFNKKRKRTNENDLEKQKAKNGFKQKILLIDNENVSVQAIKVCLNCSYRFKDFDFIFHQTYERFLPSCPNCKCNILDNKFISE